MEKCRSTRKPTPKKPIFNILSDEREIHKRTNAFKKKKKSECCSELKMIVKNSIKIMKCKITDIS